MLKKHFLFAIIIFNQSLCVNALSKLESYELLKKSDKWKLAEILVPEAREKSSEIESRLRPRTALVFTEFAARTNPIQYGLQPGTNPVTTIGFGSSAIETEWTVMDPMARAQLLLYKSKEFLNADQTLQYQTDLTALMLIEYLSVQKLKRQFELSEASLKKSETLLHLATTKKAVGAGIPLEVARARNLVNLDRIKKMSTYNKYLKAKHDLSALLGLDRLNDDLDPLQAKVLQFDSYEDVLNKALQSRSDLKSSRQAIGFAQEAQHYAQKLVFPKLALVTQVGTTDTSVLGLAGQSLTGYVGFNLIIPLDSGGLIETKRTESLMVVRKSEIGLREKINEVTSQIKESLENLNLAEEALKAAQAYVQTSREETHIADQRYLSGSSNIIDYSSAYTGLASANDNLNEAEYSYEAAKVSYYKAIGDFHDYF